MVERERPRDYAIPGLFHGGDDLAETIGPALASLPIDIVPEFLRRLALAVVAHERGDEDQLGQLLLGVVADYRLNRNPSYRQAVKEIERAEETGPPEETDRDALLADLRARR